MERLLLTFECGDPTLWAIFHSDRGTGELMEDVGGRAGLARYGLAGAFQLKCMNHKFVEVEQRQIDYSRIRTCNLRLNLPDYLYQLSYLALILAVSLFLFGVFLHYTLNTVLVRFPIILWTKQNKEGVSVLTKFTSHHRARQTLIMPLWESHPSFYCEVYQKFYILSQLPYQIKNCENKIRLLRFDVFFHSAVYKSCLYEVRALWLFCRLVMSQVTWSINQQTVSPCISG